MEESTQPGYIYVLLNYSMPGLFKIGLTSRSPRDRVSQLSSATGVPSPFVLAYDILVPDAARAERQIHEALSARGYRIAENREFFEAPLDLIIRLMLRTRDAMDSSALELAQSAAVDQVGSGAGYAVIDTLLAAYVDTNEDAGAALPVAALVAVAIERSASCSDAEADRVLGLVGLRIENRGKRVLLIANTSDWVEELFSETTLAGRVQESLRELPGVVPGGMVRFHKNLASRTTAVPLTLVERQLDRLRLGFA
jgi:hypothetical protein